MGGAPDAAPPAANVPISEAEKELEELEKRLSSGPFSYELRIQLAGPGDDTSDPTTAWPEDREIVTLGRMTISEFAGTECDGMIFDPGRVIEGIERSDDPILHARSPAYSVSFARRTEVP